MEHGAILTWTSRQNDKIMMLGLEIAIISSLVLCVKSNTIKGCPRYLASSCLGPYTLRPSAPKVPQTCTRVEAAAAAAMEGCVQQCMSDLCCRACGLREGSCVMVDFHTEAFHFVKLGQQWPILPSKCLEATGCTFELGTVSGTAFSLKQPFLESAADLKAISGQLNDYIVEVVTDYGNGFIGTQTLSEGTVSFRCDLSPGEYITEVTLYIGPLFDVFPIAKGVQFVSTLKTCGPFGQVTDDPRTAKGHMLLYIEGYSGMAFDMWRVAFWKC